MKLQKNRLAFTLIELLVVITIIGILATGTVSVFTTQIQKARDSTRLTDLGALRSSVEQYYQDTSEYPQGGANWLAGSSVSVQDYIPKFPKDPKDHQTCNSGTKCGYAYIVAADSNLILKGAYELSTGFENSGNTSQKGATDGGNDNVRLEYSVGSAVLITAKPSTANWGSTALGTTDSSTSIHIGGISSTSTGTTITAF